MSESNSQSNSHSHSHGSGGEEKMHFQVHDFHGVKGSSLHMWIPTEAVGKVIGKKGAVITHIQLTTQTEVVVLTIPESGSVHWSPVIITGEPYKVLQAFELIKEIVEETDDIVVEFPTPKQRIYHGLFYGNHHDAVKYLSADTNVRINVPDGHTNLHHQISLEGGAENVFRALKKFADVLSNPDYLTPKTASSINAPLKSRIVTSTSTSTSSGNGSCITPIVAHDTYFEQTAKIPAPIVGLLLIRRSPEPNIIHQIRQLTNTTILKVETPDGTNPDEEIQVTEMVEEEKYLGAHTAKFNPRGFEIFSIRGAKEADVVLASSCLSRIVGGEKIFYVMNELRMLRAGNNLRSEDLKRPEPVELFLAGRGRGGRLARGRGFAGPTRGGHSLTHQSHQKQPKHQKQKQHQQQHQGDSSVSTSTETKDGSVILSEDHLNKKHAKNLSSSGSRGDEGGEATTVSRNEEDKHAVAAGNVEMNEVDVDTNANANEDDCDDDDNDDDEQDQEHEHDRDQEEGEGGRGRGEHSSRGRGSRRGGGGGGGSGNGNGNGVIVGRALRGRGRVLRGRFRERGRGGRARGS